MIEIRVWKRTVYTITKDIELLKQRKKKRRFSGFLGEKGAESCCFRGRLNSVGDVYVVCIWM